MLLSVGARFNGSNLLKRAVDIIPNLKFWKNFLSIWGDRQWARIVRIIVPLWGMICSKVWAIVYCYIDRHFPDLSSNIEVPQIR